MINMKRREFIVMSGTLGASAALSGCMGIDGKEAEENAVALGDYEVSTGGSRCFFDESGNCYEVTPVANKVSKVTASGQTLWETETYVPDVTAYVDNNNNGVYDTGDESFYNPGIQHLNHPIDGYVLFNRIFVADFGNRRVAVFDATTGQFVAKIDASDYSEVAFESVKDAASTPEGITYVCDSMGSQILAFDLKGNNVLRFGSFGAQITEDAGDTLQRFDENGNVVDALEDALSFPRSLAFDPDSNLHVVDGGNQQIVVFNQMGKVVMRYGIAEEAVKSFHSIAIDKDGLVYVSDPQSGHIHIFTKEGKWVSHQKPLLNGNEVIPFELAWKPDGTLYIASQERQY